MKLPRYIWLKTRVRADALPHEPPPGILLAASCGRLEGARLGEGRSEPGLLTILCLGICL